MERGSHLCVLTPIGSKRKIEDPGEDNSCDDSSYGDSSYEVIGEDSFTTVQTRHSQFSSYCGDHLMSSFQI